MDMMTKNRRAAKLALIVVVSAGATLAAGETKKEFRFTVRAGATVSIVNPYGPISLKPAVGNQVLVTVTLHSDKVEVSHEQSGKRVELRSQLLPGADQNTGAAEYIVFIPSTTSVNLHSNTGPLRVEKLRGDVIVEAVSAVVEVRDINNVHVHIKTMNGPITLSNIHDGHVEVTSISGDVNLNSVSGPLVQVNSSSGKIRYDGDFGAGGDYSLTSHTGDIDAIAPAQAPINVTAQTVRGKVDSDFDLEARRFAPRDSSDKSSFLGKAWSLVKLRSFSGKIHLRKR
jgi:DUF4097 and DUF4098 domain-containing protein YvlB